MAQWISGFGITEGETPEPLTVHTLDGDPVDLGEIVGDGPILLEVWATWCGVCRSNEPELHAAYEAYGDRVEFIILAPNVSQDPDGIRSHLADRPLPGRILWDPDNRMVRELRAPGTGLIVILDENGTVAYSGTGMNQDIRGALAEIVDGG